jgi:putative two-component system response regulator
MAAELGASYACLEERVAARTRELEKAAHTLGVQNVELARTHDVTVFALARLAESRDPETGEHLERVRSYCGILTEELSRAGPYRAEVDAEFVETIYRSSPLHDIGKVGIPDVILLKPGQLSDGEFELMKRHTLIGAEVLAEAASVTGGRFLKMAADIARCHHEHFDGKGYPSGLCGREIPLAARIVALADVYDALTSTRVYKTAFNAEVARSMIQDESGGHFDPAVVEAFQRRFDDFVAVRERLGSTAAQQDAAIAGAPRPGDRSREVVVAT